MRCPNCGFEDEGNFCSNCGKSLQQPVTSLSSKLVLNLPWYDKCPVCKIGKLNHEEQKSAFGLVKGQHFICDHCGADFLQARNEYYALMDLPDKNHPFWLRYKKQALTPQYIKNLAYGNSLDSYGNNPDIQLWMDAIEQNTAEPVLEAAQNLMLKKGEYPLLSLNNITLKEPRSVRVTHGGYAGPRIRVAKGVSFNLGAFGASSESHEEIKVIDNGNLLLTNKRLIFSGSKRSINIQLKKIISIDAYGDGIALRRENKQKTEYFVGLNNGNFVVKDETGSLYRYSLHGMDLMTIIGYFVE